MACYHSRDLRCVLHPGTLLLRSRCWVQNTSRIQDEEVNPVLFMIFLFQAQCAQKVKENEVFRECMGEINQELKLRDVTLALRDKRIKSYQNTISSLCVK